MPAKPNAKPPNDTPPSALREDGFVGNGYIWHTTGSDKTITPFKASTLLKEIDSIQQRASVIDRKLAPPGVVKCIMPCRVINRTRSLNFLGSFVKIGSQVARISASLKTQMPL